MNKELKLAKKYVELFTDNSNVLLLFTIRGWLANCVLTTNQPMVIKRAIIEHDEVMFQFTFRKTKHLLIFPLDDTKRIVIIKGGYGGKRIEVDSVDICAGKF